MPSVDPFSLIPQTKMKPRDASAQLGCGRQKDFAHEVCFLNYRLAPLFPRVFIWKRCWKKCKSDYGDLNENAFQKLVHLKTQSPDCETVWEGLRGVAFVGDVCHCGRLWGFKRCKDTIPSILFASGLWMEIWALNCLCHHTSLHHCGLQPSETVSPTAIKALVFSN